MTNLPDFHGPHVSPRSDAELLEWRKLVRRFARVRVLRHTCECAPYVYEFCPAGGLAWVRKTSRLGSGLRVLESHPDLIPKAKELWEKIMNGQAN